MNEKKVLVAYYSYSGNTRKIAQEIQRIVGADLFEIKPLREYPRNYNDVVNQAKQEKQDDFKPELVDNGNVEKYDVIYLGTPVWWYTISSPIRTFLSNNNFDGKTIIPFCTHGGGGASSSYDDMKKIAKGAEFKKGFSSFEYSAKTAEIEDWIRGL